MYTDISDFIFYRKGTKALSDEGFLSFKNFNETSSYFFNNEVFLYKTLTSLQILENQKKQFFNLLYQNPISTFRVLSIKSVHSNKNNLPFSIDIFFFELQSFFITVFVFTLIIIVSSAESSVFLFKKTGLIQYKNMLPYKYFVFFSIIFLLSLFNVFLSLSKLFDFVFYKNILVSFNTLLLLSLIIQLPIIFFFNVGSFFFLKVKGSLKRKNRTLTILEDFSSFFTYLIRYFIQTLRWILILVSSFMINESVYSALQFKHVFNALDASDITLCNTSLTWLLSSLLKLTIEYFDLLFMVSVQLSAFCTLLFWLLSFLFSTTIKNFFETI